MNIKTFGTGVWSLQPNKLEEILNAYGKDGWKVVATIERDSYTEQIVLLKEKQ